MFLNAYMKKLYKDMDVSVVAIYYEKAIMRDCTYKDRFKGHKRSAKIAG